MRHGIERRARPGMVEIRARLENGTLRLDVRDNGPGLPVVPPKRHGIGVANTRARLQQLYGASHQFTLENHPEGGVLARTVIPHRTMPPSSGPSNGTSAAPPSPIRS